MFSKTRFSLMPDAAPGGGGGTAQTVDPNKSPLEQAISKVFPEEADAAAPTAPEKKEPPTDGKKPDGGTNDLSQPAKPAPKEGEETPEQKQQREAEEATEAKEAGMSVEDYRTAKAAEQQRLEAIVAKTGETFEQIYAREEKDGQQTDLEAAKPGEKKTFTQEEMEAAIQKRVKNLATENADLKRQLAEKPAAVAGAGPLDNISDPNKLADIEAEAQTGLEQADDLLTQLRDDPDGVEQVLRKFYGEKADSMDFSPANMRQILRNAKEGFRSTLKAVPQRKQWLEANAKAEPIALKTHPWLEDPADERTVMFNQMAQQMPVLKQNPAWRYWLGHAVAGHLAAVAAVQKAQPGKGKPGTVKLKIKSAMPGTGRVTPAAKTKGNFSEAKAKGDVDAMAGAIFGEE